MFDIKLTDGTFIELKSYVKKSLESIPSSTKFVNQFKQYLQSLSTTGNDISKLKYVFNSKKVSEKEVKDAFVKLFNTKAEEIFNANPSVFNNDQLKIFTVSDLEKVTATHPIFNFLTLL